MNGKRKLSMNRMGLIRDYKPKNICSSGIKFDSICMMTRMITLTREVPIYMMYLMLAILVQPLPFGKGVVL